jgi:hypothetical protein
MPPSRAIEMHDSTLTAISWTGPDLVLSLDAYLQVSDGDPGKDAGAGWTQQAELRLGAATLVTAPTEPLWISDGKIRVRDHTFADMLLLPFVHEGPVEIRFEGAEGLFCASGASVSVTLFGTPIFVEDVPA